MLCRLLRMVSHDSLNTNWDCRQMLTSGQLRRLLLDGQEAVVGGGESGA